MPWLGIRLVSQAKSRRGCSPNAGKFPRNYNVLRHLKWPDEMRNRRQTESGHGSLALIKMMCPAGPLDPGGRLLMRISRYRWFKSSSGGPFNARLRFNYVRVLVASRAVILPVSPLKCGAAQRKGRIPDEPVLRVLHCFAAKLLRQTESLKRPRSKATTSKFRSTIIAEK